MSRKRNCRFQDALKRALDVVGAIVALVVFSPVLLVSAVLVKLDGGPVLFVQERVGKNNRRFGVFKLRTMVTNAHEMEPHLRREHATNGGYGVPGEYSDPRVTRIGALLRLLNIDEMPQFLNVLKGDMSLVGPRPVPYGESLLYGDRRGEVFSVKPGITGYWQIKRRMKTNYKERAELDCYYVRNQGTLLDAYILLATPISMLTSDYNSMTKPLPPVDGVLVSDRKVAAATTDSGAARPEPLIRSKADRERSPLG